MVVPFDSFYVGNVLVEPVLYRITGAEGPTAVEPKVMEVLLCLARRPGAVVPREVLLAEVWAGTVVTDHVLTRAVSELRKALGDRSRPPALVETIPKAGYRLAAPVHFLTHGDTGGDHVPGWAERVPVVSVAPPPAHTRGRSWRPGVAAAVVLLAATAGLFLTRAPAPPPVTRPLTTYPGLELAPAFSPDGSQVAFLRVDGDTTDLYVRPVEAEAPLRLTTHPGQEGGPVWSPDGQRIAFTRMEQGGCMLYVVSALGGNEEALTGCGTSYGGLDWSPDGAWLVVSEAPSAGAPRRLVRLSARTLARRRMTTPPGGASDIQPVYAPDGRTLAFVRSTAEGVTDLYAMPADRPGATPRRLTHDHAAIAGHAWTPDGRRIVFSSNRDGLYRVWSVPADGGRVTPFPEVSAWDPGGPVFDTPGRRMAYVEWFYVVNVWRMPGPAGPTGAAPVRVAPSTRSDYHPDVSPGGDRLAFVSNRSGSAEIWAGRADGSRIVRLTGFGDASTAQPRWSPDGRRLAFTTRRDGQADVYVVDAAGGRALRLTDTPFDEAHPTWSADGRSLYFTTRQPQGWTVWKMPAAGGTAVPVVAPAVEAFESPDGRRLFYTRPDTSGIWAFEPGHPARRVADAHAIAGRTPWYRTPTGLYFLRIDAGIPVLFRHAFADEQTTRVAALPPSALTTEVGFAVSPDDAWVYYASRDRFESDLMMVDLPADPVALFSLPSLP